ncbi:MAG: hypothetical protein H5T82_05925 [Demequina sp.]|uniref:hypothetical protein n=1 Tax=Demequina sp. TaxID=2050685 RepID=UPI0019A242E2|nr:hypothetical protein [Demequina sp.]MBC7298414.1 hypothetical protein [Demequina sp.]
MSHNHLTSRGVAVAALAAVWVLVLLSLVVSPAVAVLGMAVFALAGAAARTAAPLRRAFVVRERAVDIVVLSALGLALGYLGLTAALG